MNATVTVKYDPQNAVPSDKFERVAWLDKFGPQPLSAEVTISLPLAEWARTHATIDCDGKVDLRVPCTWGNDRDSNLYAALQAAAIEVVRLTGTLPQSLDESLVARLVAEDEARLAQERAEADAEVARNLVLKQKREAEEKVVVERLRALPIDAWVHQVNEQWVGYTSMDQDGNGLGGGYALPDGLGDMKVAASKEAERRNQVFAQVEVEAMRTWLLEYQPDKLVRFNDGFMPNDEVYTIVREHLFSVFSGMERYQRLTSGDVNHGDECCHAVNVYDVNPAGSLTDGQYATLQEFKQKGGEGFTYEARQHSAKCDTCECDGEVRASLLITTAWLGKELSREYAL